MIKAITAKASARVFRVVALPAPSDRERTQLYLQRYINEMPAAGEVVLFDRSWYNRAGVEPVMGFCTPDQTNEFLATVPPFERWLNREGIILLKYWLEIGERTSRKSACSTVLMIRSSTGSSVKWILKAGVAGMPIRARVIVCSMQTDTEESPWYVVPSDCQRTARLNCISHILEQIPYEAIERRVAILPGRDLSDEYDDVAAMEQRRTVPQKF